MSNFANLKKQSKLGSLTEKLVKEVEKMNSTGSSTDDRIWTLTVDKAQNGYAVIRFLPAPDGEDLPFVKVYNHAFQGPGGWLIDECLTTINQKCPVCEYNSGLWNNGTDSGKEQARKQKRKLSYISNIYVVKDPANPENEGKVFLFKYGKKIFDKIMEAMQPEFEDEDSIDPFDFWTGANFKLKAKNVAGYRNYDSSEFAKSGPLLDDDNVLEAIWKKQYSLSEFVTPDKFKSYDELKKRLDYVLGNKGTPRYQDPEDLDEDNTRGSVKELDDDLREELSSLKPTRRAAVEEDEDDADETLSYFAKLAE